MSRVYENEIARFPETINWAIQIDIREILSVIKSASSSPLRAIGSGGSLTTAHVLSYFHQLYTGNIATVSTPLETIHTPLEPSVSHWLLTASGDNVDVLAAARTLIGREPSQFVVLCGREDSSLGVFCRAYPFVDLLFYPPPSGKDGFLATNSLLGFTTLVSRAYMMEFGPQEEWKATAGLIKELLSPESKKPEQWRKQIKPLWDRPTTLVLHGSSTRIGAIDLESKFTEAALGNVQLADFRNFAHGRHHWLAKRGHESSVIAFVTDEDRLLAKRTLDLIPPDVPKVQIKLPGSSAATAILSLIAALKICGWAGQSRGIDPGRPGVPEFGRRLYRLKLPSKVDDTVVNWSERDQASIVRKSGMSLRQLRKVDKLTYWKSCLDKYRASLLKSNFAGVVMDFDGTLVNVRDRFRPPSTGLIEELVRLLEEGAWIGIATGRGVSVRRDLQKCLPCTHWERVLIGYYNGAEIALLNNNDIPAGDNSLSKNLRIIATAFRAAPEVNDLVNQIDRRYQISLEPKQTVSMEQLWDTVHQFLLSCEISDFRMFRSSHSLDILAEGVSKTNILAKLREYTCSFPILKIGDQGRWPGNDYELLLKPYSLSVNVNSNDPRTCWNLAKPGQRGPVVTLDYISSLESINSGFRFKPEAFR